MSVMGAGTSACCRNHPQVAGIDRCAGCAEPFCFNCLVKIQGVHYCGQCKVMALQGKPMVEAAMVPCKEADEALKYAIAAIFTSLFCIGVVIGPIAIAKGTKAKQIMAQNPYLIGSGKATAAVVIGTLCFLFSLFAIIKGQARH